MLAFIQSQPNVVERLLRHIETPAFVDLLVRIMQLDEQHSGSGVLEVSPHPSLHCTFPDISGSGYHLSVS